MRAVNSAAMSGGLSWASVSVQVKPGGIFGQQGEVVRVLRRRFWSIPARHADGLPDLHLRPCVEARVLSPAQEWVGLPAWRTSAVNELRVWGKRGPTAGRDEWEYPAALAAKKSDVAGEFFRLHWENRQVVEARVEELGLGLRGASLAEWGAVVLGAADPVEKAVFTHHAYRLWCNGELPLGVAQAPDSPARPEKPELVRVDAFPLIPLPFYVS
jgi:hypothetical protein